MILPVSYRSYYIVAAIVLLISLFWLISCWYYGVGCIVVISISMLRYFD